MSSLQSCKIFLIFSIFIFCFLQNIPCQANTRDGLVGWWRLNDASSGTCTSTVADSSGQGNTGTCSNSPSWVSGKIWPNALSFNGSNQYESIPWPWTPDVTSAFQNATLTYCSWIKTSGLTNSEMGIMGVGDSGNHGWNSALFNKHFYFWYSQAGPASNSSPSNATISDGQWFFLCGVASSATTISLYINGILDHSFSSGISTPFTITAVNSQFVIGNEGQRNVARYFSGSIDDVRVYNRALTAKEVMDLYNPGIVIRNATLRNVKLNT